MMNLIRRRNGRLKLVYIISQFPEFHETFIAREVESLLRAGVDLQIYSLKHGPREHFLYAHHERITRDYPLVLSLRNWMALLRAAVTKPLKLGWCFRQLFRFYWKDPSTLLKTLAILPMVTRIAEDLEFSKGDVHAHWATVPTSMAMIISHLADVRFSFTAHAWDIYLTPDKELTAKLLASRGVLTCTSFNVSHLARLAPEAAAQKVHLNYHGVDFKAIDDHISGCVKSTPPTFVAIGRMVEQKGFEYLVRAVALLPPDLELEVNIIGDGPLRPALEALCGQLLKGKARINFLGRLKQKDTLRTVARARALVAPSVIAGDGDRDGIPNVILEAMGCRVPVVASSVSGIPEVVIPGDSGWLVPERDAPALAVAMRDVLDHPDEAERRGRQARLIVEERFDFERNCEELRQHLEHFHDVAA